VCRECGVCWPYGVGLGAQAGGDRPAGLAVGFSLSVDSESRSDHSGQRECHRGRHEPLYAQDAARWWRWLAVRKAVSRVPAWAGRAVRHSLATFKAYTSTLNGLGSGKGTPPRLYFTYLGHAGWEKPIGP
jgi:hypothetical protein